ncbi:MAG: hypothetical protein VB070_15680 [Clostridiaceae bacterium]|nr:hypothetical protein [Clostridiaceae bacterium]
MAIKEGRCPNCGSILQLDAAAEKGHCLFCDAVFENAAAFDIAANPAGVTFPNTPQPKYEGPSLDPHSVGGQQALKQIQQQPAKKKAKPAPPPVYVHKAPVKLPDIKLSRKTKLRIILISIISAAVIAGIGVPVVMTRNANRQALLQSVETLAPFAVDADTSVAIWHTNNNYVILSTPDKVTEQETVDFFEAFCRKRAEIMSIDTNDFGKTYGRVTVKLVTPEGGYLIAKPGSQTDLDNGTAVEKLP